MTTAHQGSSDASKHCLTNEELIRYGRQIALPQLGHTGQERLNKSSAAIIGLGGLGSPCAIYLAAAGIGRIGLVDSDHVVLSNLHRQIVHTTATLGRAKTESAAELLKSLNPYVEIRIHHTRLHAENAMALLGAYDVIVDATDNFEARYTANDTCVLLGKPLVYGSIFRFEGQASVFDARKGPCYRCLYPEPPPPELVPDCVQGGVIGVLPGIMGTIEAAETIKLAAGIGEPLIGRLLHCDALRMNFRETAFEKNPSCPSCGPKRELNSAKDLQRMAAWFRCVDADINEIEPIALQAALTGENPPLLLDVREPDEYEYCHLSGSILIPLGELANRLRELDRKRTVAVYCQSGCRSATAARQLREAGFPDVLSLAGGIRAWAEHVDRSMPKY